MATAAARPEQTGPPDSPLIRARGVPGNTKEFARDTVQLIPNRNHPRHAHVLKTNTYILTGTLVSAQLENKTSFVTEKTDLKSP